MGTAALALLVCAGLVVLSVWLPVAGARRWVTARWRPFAASVGAALGLAVTGWLAVVWFTAVAAG
jgi:hypothetical protein